MGIETTAEKKENYIHFTLKGDFPGMEILNGFDKIIEVSNKFKIKNVLLDIREFNYDLTDFERYSIGEYISKNYGKNLIKIACLRKRNKKEDFTSIVAKNRGASFNFFNDEIKAINWLKE